MSNYWLADQEARVLGPVSLEVVRDLAVRGKLGEVRAVSKDGRTFVPLREVPEIVAVLSPPKGEEEHALAQARASKQVRDWLGAVRERPAHELFNVPQGASTEAYRAAFFALVHRYLPSRLPPDASAELRLACEDAFLFLAGHMVDVERQRQRSAPKAAPAIAPSPPAPRSTPATVSYRGGVLHVSLSLSRGDAAPFTAVPEVSWRDDSLYVATTERAFQGAPAEVLLAFEGHVTQLSSSGRVVLVKAGEGLGIKLLGLGEPQRAMIRTWVQRAGG